MRYIVENCTTCSMRGQFYKLERMQKEMFKSLIFKKEKSTL